MEQLKEEKQDGADQATPAYSVMITDDDKGDGVECGLWAACDVANYLLGVLRDRFAVINDGEEGYRAEPGEDAVVVSATEYVMRATKADLIGRLARMRPDEYLRLMLTDGEVMVNRLA